MNSTRPLGYNLKIMRLSLGKSQDAMAELCGISLRLYQGLETGKGNPTISTLNRIATTFKKTASDLLRLTIIKTELKQEDFIKKFKSEFENISVAARLQNLDGVVLWTNKTSKAIDNITSLPLDLMENLPEHSKVLLRSQLECERRGLILPYLNSITNKDGKEIILRYYPVHIIPAQSFTPFFSAVYFTFPREDCEANYYKFCETLINCR